MWTLCSKRNKAEHFKISLENRPCCFAYKKNLQQANESVTQSSKTSDNLKINGATHSVQSLGFENKGENLPKMNSHFSTHERWKTLKPDSNTHSNSHSSPHQLRSKRQVLKLELIIFFGSTLRAVWRFKTNVQPLDFNKDSSNTRFRERAKFFV